LLLIVRTHPEALGVVGAKRQKLGTGYSPQIEYPNLTARRSSAVHWRLVALLR
jgi:hypothetical protein